MYSTLIGQSAEMELGMWVNRWRERQDNYNIRHGKVEDDSVGGTAGRHIKESIKEDKLTRIDEGRKQ